MSGMFHGLSSLEELYLSSNEISYIQMEAFSTLTACITLQLNDNKLTALQSTMFRGLHSLKSLELFSNNICDIEKGSFWNLTQCRELYLSSNKLTHL